MTSTTYRYCRMLYRTGCLENGRREPLVSHAVVRPLHLGPMLAALALCHAGEGNPCDGTSNSCAGPVRWAGEVSPTPSIPSGRHARRTKGQLVGPGSVDRSRSRAAHELSGGVLDQGRSPQQGRSACLSWLLSHLPCWQSASCATQHAERVPRQNDRGAQKK